MRIPIFCYHKVGPVDEEGRFLNVEPSTFRSHVRFLKRRFRIVPLRDLLQGWPERAAILTFDDAYVSATTHGVDVLNSERVAGTFFAVPKYVGQSSCWDSDRARPLESWDGLRRIQSQGHEVGNHTWSHADLSSLTREEQVQEWKAAEAAFVKERVHIETACYPYGRTNHLSSEAVCEAGISCAVRIGKRIATASDPLALLPRIVIAYSDAIPKLLYKMYVRPLLP